MSTPTLPTPPTAPIAAPSVSPAPTAAPTTPAFNLATASDAEIAARYITPAPDAPAADAPAETPAEAPVAAPDAEITFDETVGRHRDATGRFVKPDGTPDDDTPAPAAAAAEPEPAATEPAKPKPYTITDADGELDVPDGVTVTFKLAGKEKTATIAEVVRMAQSGGYNEQLQAEVKETRAAQQQLAAREQTWQQERTQLQTALQAVQQREAQIDQQIAAFFADPAHYEAARQQFAAQHSPEQRAARAEHQLRQFEQQQAVQQATAQGHQAFVALIAPRMDALFQKLDDPVVHEAIKGRAFTLIDTVKAQYGVQGMVPPHLLPEVAARIDRELAPWVESLHEQRTTQSRQVAATQTAERQALEARLAAQQRATTDAKRAFARRVAPAGAAAADTPPPKPIKSADDAISRILERAASGQYSAR